MKNVLFLKRYVVWNSYKIETLYSRSGDTYEQLLLAENSDLSSCSSVVFVNDIDSYITSVYNETDVELKYHFLPFSIGEYAAMVRTYMKRLLASFIKLVK